MIWKVADTGSSFVGTRKEEGRVAVGLQYKAQSSSSYSCADQAELALFSINPATHHHWEILFLSLEINCSSAEKTASA